MKIITLKSLLIFTFLSTLFFTGCSEKSATKYSNKDPRYAQFAKYTKIVKLTAGDEIKAIVNITYLNRSEPEKWNDGYQHFIIGRYIPDNNVSKVDLQRVFNNNLIEMIDQETIDTESELYKNIPFKNSWATYQKIKFKNIKQSKVLELKVSLGDLYPQHISFLKEQSIVFDTFD